jgi:hypothetical protein
VTDIAPATRAAVLRAIASGKQLYLACHQGGAGERGALEVDGRPYERLALRLVERDGAWVNADELRFLMPECWVRYLGVWDAQRAGRFVIGEFTEERELALGDTYIVPAGTVRVVVPGGVREGTAA